MAKKTNKTFSLIQGEAKKLWEEKSKLKLKTYADAISMASKNLKKKR